MAAVDGTDVEAQLAQALAAGEIGDDATAGRIAADLVAADSRARAGAPHPRGDACSAQATMSARGVTPTRRCGCVPTTGPGTRCARRSTSPRRTSTRGRARPPSAPSNSGRTSHERTRCSARWLRARATSAPRRRRTRGRSNSARTMPGVRHDLAYAQAAAVPVLPGAAWVRGDARRLSRSRRARICAWHSRGSSRPTSSSSCSRRSSCSGPTADARRPSGRARRRRPGVARGLRRGHERDAAVPARPRRCPSCARSWPTPARCAGPITPSSSRPLASPVAADRGSAAGVPARDRHDGDLDRHRPGHARRAAHPPASRAARRG